jgi:GT2 family glycosyltransferase
VSAVTIVIPTYRRRASLERTLGGVAAQEWPADRLEVIVVSDGGEDGSVEMARAFPMPFPLRALWQPNQGPGAARNRGLDHANGSLVVFLDDDVVPAPRLVAEHVRAHGDAHNRVVMGPMLEPPNARLLPWVRWEARTLAEQYEAMLAGRWAPTPWQFYTGNASVRPERVREAGGFDLSYRRAEDIELAFRLERVGCEFVFNPDAAGLHFAERSYRSWLGAAYQYGRNDIRFGKAERVAGEFRYRHPLTRALIRWGLRHRGAAAALGLPTRAAIRAAHAVGLRPLAQGLCGAIFNLHYWLGVADQVGDRTAARELARI